jgi:hypothetical protein
MHAHVHIHPNSHKAYQIVEELLGSGGAVCIDLPHRHRIQQA